MKKEFKKILKRINRVISNTVHSLHGSSGTRVQDLENTIKLIDTVILALLLAGIGQLAYVFGGDTLAILKAVGIEGAVAALAKGASLSKSDKVKSALYWTLGFIMMVSGYANFLYAMDGAEYETQIVINSFVLSATIPLLVLSLTYARISLDGEWRSLTQNQTLSLEDELKKIKSKKGPKSSKDKMRIFELETELGLTI
jgi:hypothetical protein